MSKQQQSQQKKRDSATSGGASPGSVVGLRLSFYREGFRALVVVTPLLLGASIISGVAAIKALNSPTLVRYVSVDSKNRIAPIVPRSEPYVSDAGVTKFASDCILRSYRMDGVNYNTQLLDSYTCFTSAGFDGFKRLLTTSKTVEYLQATKAIASPEPVGPAVITKRDNSNGVFTWYVRMPVKVSYFGVTNASRNFVVDVVIERMETIERVDPMGVAQFNAFEQR